MHRIEFYRYERGMGDEDWYYLACNGQGRAFVLHEWSHRTRDGFEPGSAHVELDAFLSRRGTARDRLAEIIGTLVKESGRAHRT